MKWIPIDDAAKTGDPIWGRIDKNTIRRLRWCTVEEFIEAGDDPREVLGPGFVEPDDLEIIWEPTHYLPIEAIPDPLN